MHYHVRTDTMRGMGTFDDPVEAVESATRLTRSRAYTREQLRGGARAYTCDCWMGEYVLDKRDEAHTRSANHTSANCPNEFGTYAQLTRGLE